MAKKYPHVGFRPDPETKEILDLISEQGRTKSRFINDAIKYYYKNQDQQTIEQVIDDLKTAIKEIKNTTLIRAEEKVAEEPSQENESDIDLDEMILEIGNDFVAWGEAPKEVKKEKPFTKDDEDIFVDDDDIEI